VDMDMSTSMLVIKWVWG